MELMNENKESGEHESLPEIIPLQCDARKERKVTKLFEDGKIFSFIFDCFDYVLVPKEVSQMTFQHPL